MTQFRTSFQAFCKAVRREIFNPYRPERHYMRGPRQRP